MLDPGHRVQPGFFPAGFKVTAEEGSSAWETPEMSLFIPLVVKETTKVICYSTSDPVSDTIKSYIFKRCF